MRKTAFLEKSGVGLANWSEKWFPDALVFAFLGIIIVFFIGISLGISPENLALEGGKSFWSLIPFTMQMIMVLIGGYVVASSPWIYKCIQWLASRPKTPKSAVAFIAFFSMTTSLLSWGFSLIFSGLLARECARKIRGMDYRAAAAAAYLGLGAVWALGFSSSAALMMATQSTIPPKLLAISGVIPLSQTLITWGNFWMIISLIGVSVFIAYFSAPDSNRAKTAENYGIHLEPLRFDLESRKKPGEWLEYSPFLNLTVACLLGFYLIHVFRSSPQGVLAALDLNTYNLIFITLGLLLHWRPKRFGRAVSQAVPSVSGILIQYPFYAFIFGMITGTGLVDQLSHFFVSYTTQNTYPLLIAVYSAVLGVFIPSGGSKWVIEAPYLLSSAIEHHMNLGWVVQIYNAAEALPNLLNPFFMLPLVGILQIKARDVVGFTVLQLIVHTPIVLFLCWYFSLT